MRRAVEWTDLKTMALIVFAAAQAALVFGVLPVGAFSYPALVLLSAVLPVGLVSLSPLIDKVRQVPFIDPKMDKRFSGDCLIVPHDIAKYPHSELVIRLDKYLGGGVTATPYYEDIVGQIITAARIATRKRQLFLAACVLAGAAQLGLLWQLVRG
jgi:hypothetical protein